jgi:HSP20 family protein
MALLKRDTKPIEPMFDHFENMLDDWMKSLAFRRPSMFGREWMAEELIRVDEYQENGNLVVRAELPGIDPDRDVELTVTEGMLHIRAERREEEQSEEKGYVRRELRYGSFSRTLGLPEGVTEADIDATYKDGMLEIRVPAPEVKPARKIPISKK